MPRSYMIATPQSEQNSLVVVSARDVNHRGRSAPL